MSKILLTLALALSVQCFPVPVTPARADASNCTTTCHVDSGGHTVCHTRCR